MNNELQKKYGLPTATACCVFFCAAAVVALAIPFYRPEAKAQ